MIPKVANTPAGIIGVVGGNFFVFGIAGRRDRVATTGSTRACRSSPTSSTGWNWNWT